MLKTTKFLISKSFPEDIIMPDDYLKVKVKSLSHVQLFATPWTVPLQAPPSKGFSRQEYWSRVPLSLVNIALISHIQVPVTPEGEYRGGN